MSGMVPDKPGWWWLKGYAVYAKNSFEPRPRLVVRSTISGELLDSNLGRPVSEMHGWCGPCLTTADVDKERIRADALEARVADLESRMVRD